MGMDEGAAKTMKEVWKQIAKHPRYMVSNLGRIRSRTKIRKLVPNNRRGGYLGCSVVKNGKHFLLLVHVLVAENFVGPRPFARAEVRHLDGDVTNNRFDNLRWGDRDDQFADQVRHGTDTRGPRNGNARLTQREADTIRSSFRSGKILSETYGVSQSTISRIRGGQRYAS